MHYIDELEKADLKGKRVLLRLDLNVPIEKKQITDTYRLEKTIDTVDFLRQMEAKTIIISHAENNEGENESLLPMFDYLNGYFPVKFSSTYFTAESEDQLLKLEDKEVLLFENVRNNAGEKENDSEFAKKLAQMGDIYVNDAFSVSHRKHASIVGVPEFLPHYGGLLMQQEIIHLSKVFNPEHPFVFILGGAKFDTKLPLIKKYLDIADKVFVGGALAHNFFKQAMFEIGTSLIAEGDFGLGKILNNRRLNLPRDVTVKKTDGSIAFKIPDEVTSDDCIVDAGPKTLDQLTEILKDVKTIVWNGPLGNYEAGFSDKTESLAEIIALATKNGASSIVGGGDTVASINKLGLNENFSFVSTGGGAMLDYLIDETLPGIEALS